MVGDGAGKVTLFLSTGIDPLEDTPFFNTGTFIQPGGVDIAAGRAVPEVNDWNEDGKKDLLVSTVGGRVQVYINRGTDAVPAFDAFPSANSYNLQVGGVEFQLNSRASARVFDLDGDGLKDIVFGGSGGVYFLKNVSTNDAPVFDSAEQILLADGNPLFTPFSYSRPYVTDWNNDGLNDIVVGNSGGEIILYKATSAALLTVNALPTGFGSVTKVPDQQTYLFEDVTLTASPDQGYTFISWTDCDAPSGDQCVMNMEDADKTVTALFASPSVETSVDFGSADAGTALTRTLTVANDGITPLVIDNIGVVDSTALPFSLDLDSCGISPTLAPGASCDLIVGFSPTSAGSFISSFNISNSRIISLTGIGANAPAGTNPDIYVEPFACPSFLNTSLGDTSQKTLTIWNKGSADLNNLAIGNGPSSPFSITNNCAGTLTPAASCTIDITYTAPGTSGGPDTSSFTILSDDPDEGVVTIGLIGSSIDNNPASPGYNVPPTIPVLISPANGASNVTAADFRWTAAVDLDGDPLIHTRFIDTDPSFSNPQIFGAVGSERNISYAMIFGDPIFISALFGIISLGVFLKRREITIVIAAMVFILGLLLASCGGSKETGEGERSAIVQPGQTYYWKVIADDGNGGITESDTWSLTSAPR